MTQFCWLVLNGEVVVFSSFWQLRGNIFIVNESSITPPNCHLIFVWKTLVWRRLSVLHSGSSSMKNDFYYCIESIIHRMLQNCREIDHIYYKEEATSMSPDILIFIPIVGYSFVERFFKFLIEWKWLKAVFKLIWSYFPDLRASFTMKGINRPSSMAN